MVAWPLVEVSTADVLGFIQAQRLARNGNVVRIVDGGAGLALSTIKRRLATEFRRCGGRQTPAEVNALSVR